MEEKFEKISSLRIELVKAIGMAMIGFLCTMLAEYELFRGAIPMSSSIIGLICGVIITLLGGVLIDIVLEELEDLKEA